MKHDLLKPTLTLMLAVLSACQTTPSPVPNPKPTTTELSTVQREAAMNRIVLEYEKLFSQNSATALNELVAFTKTQAEFSNAKAGEGVLSAMFKDGRAFVLLDNFDGFAKQPIFESATAPSRTIPTQSVARALGGSSSQLPASNTAVLMRQDIEDTVGNDPALNKIQKSLEKRGFRVERFGTVTVENLKAIQSLPSVFYYHGHGAMYYWDNAFEDQEYSLMTDTLISSSNDLLYEEDLKAGRLIYTRVRAKRNDSSLKPGRYAVTGRFFSKYLRLAPRALVYINACNSAEQQAALFRQSFGAGVYLGYDGSTTDFGYEPAAYFFDRLLGGNFAEPPKPHGRVFRLEQVWQAMQKKRHAQSQNADYLTDPVNNSKLLKFGNELLLLAPNIQSLEFVGLDTMQINTDVPLNEPELIVKIGSVVFPHSVENGKLRVQLEPDTTGDVTLEVRGISSNARPITSWRVPLEYTGWIAPASGQLAKLSVEFNLHLRADAYEVRHEVDGQLYEQGSAYYAAMDSHAKYQYSGSIGNGVYTGSQTLKYNFSPTKGHFSTTGYVHALSKKMRIAPLFSNANGLFVTPIGSFEIAIGQGPFEFSEVAAPVQGREIVPMGWLMELGADLSISPRQVSNQIAGIELSTVSWSQSAASPAFRDSVER